MTYTDGYLRSGSSSYPGGRYTSSGRSCGSPSGLPRSSSLLMTCSSMRPARSADQGSTGSSSPRGVWGDGSPQERGVPGGRPPGLALTLRCGEVGPDGGGDGTRCLVGSQVRGAPDHPEPGVRDA